MVDIKYIFNHYIIQSIYENNGYNPVNTLFYASIFLISIYIIYRELFGKKRIELSNEFALALSGWMVLGGVLRVLKDAGVLKSLIFVTPFIYVLVFVVVLGTIGIFRKAKEKKIIKDENRALLFTGWALVFLSMIFLNIRNIGGLLLVLGLWIMLGTMIFLISLKIRFLGEKWNFFALQAQLLDACGSFVGITYYGFWEKHVLGRYLIDLLGSKNLLLIKGSAAWVMILLKLLVVPIALWIVDRYAEEETERRFVKLLIIILGIGIGTRNTLAVGVFG
jgi:uncharacterized membrane protein